MQRLYFLLLLGLSWAQYKLKGEYRDLQRKTEIRLTLWIAPSYLRLVSEGRWDTVEQELDFLFLPTATYWIDKKAGITYDVTATTADTFPLYVHIVGASDYQGRAGLQAIIFCASGKMEIIWDESVPVDWTLWRYRFMARGLGAALRSFSRGIPLFWRTYNQRNEVEEEFRLLSVEPYEPSDAEGRPPYPVKKLGE
ncbi:MAG: hypothetical protein RMK19_02450 [Bacteroidia bacterium]|nr:hypothetical protein [Bacteroidia bacterium]MDW8014857.1 hypothetical protein [Bacteroidia bacterium]